jgi:penicillin-binding protein 2
MKTNSKSSKLSLISFFFIFAFIILALRMCQLQIIRGTEYLQLSESNRLRIINIPAPRGIIYDRNGIPLVKNSPFFYVSLIAEEFDIRNVEPLSEFLQVRPHEILKKINEADISPFVPVRLKEDLSLEEVAFIEARRSDFPGLIIEVEVSREYIFADIGSHFIGYLGKLTPEQTKNAAFKDVPPETFVGQWGIEKLFDSSLRGSPGKRIIEVDALGKELRLIQEKPPEKGKDLTVSIDIHLQKEAEKAFGQKAGALVALNPQTGEVLGLVSKPSFDPNLFSRGIDYDSWIELTTDIKTPLLNRALQSQYPPGSTFKIVTAIAGLEEHVISSQTTTDCKGAISYGKWDFRCWRRNGHGIVSLHRAIVESCDVFFYEVGKRLGIDKIHDYAINLGLGTKTGIELGTERQGLIPNTAWKKENKKLPWFLGETFNAAIGQGYVSLTPLQLAVTMGAIVNGGFIYKPILTKDAFPVVTGETHISPKTVEVVKKGLLGVVNEPGGTGWAAQSTMTAISGKTGTAQVVSMRGRRYYGEAFRDHAWFVAFAPHQHPEIVLSVLVEHGGHGGAVAAPIAKTAIEAYMSSREETSHETPGSPLTAGPEHKL